MESSQFDRQRTQPWGHSQGWAAKAHSGHPSPEQGLPHVSQSARMGFIGVGAAGVQQSSRLLVPVLSCAHTMPECPRLHPWAAQSCSSITGAAPSEVQPVTAPGKEQEELGVNTGLCLDVPVPSSNPTASPLSTPLLCRPCGDTQGDCNHCPARNTIYLWPNSHCLAWINQEENKALRKKVLNFPCSPEGMGQALAVYFSGFLFASTVSDIVFTKVFMSSEQSHSSASSPVYFM